MLAGSPRAAKPLILLKREVKIPGILDTYYDTKNLTENSQNLLI